MIFGNKTHFAVSPLAPIISALGSHVYHTHPSFDSFFSTHGFCMAIDFNITPYVDILKPPSRVYHNHIVHTETTYMYFTVYRDGTMDMPIFTRKQDGTLEVSSRPIIPQQEGWWIVQPYEGEIDNTLNMLTGFLYTNPSHDAISEFVRKIDQGRDIVWFSIEDVVARVNKDFPLDP